MKTIGVDLWGDQVRGRGANNVTCLRPSTSPRPRKSFRDLFVESYTSFSDRCREVSEPGIALVAVDEVTGKSMGLVRLLARVQRHVAAIIGRHDECDLFLNAHGRLALRHLAVVLDPVSDWRAGANVRYRVLDLRTTHGFTDECDRALRGLSAEGPAIIRCAGYVLFVLPLGDPTDWPADPHDAWSILPERVYLRESGPRDTGMMLALRDVAGVIELAGGILAIGSDTLHDGLLLGRYLRCDGASYIDDDIQLSRVHLLLLEVDGTLLAVDTASIHGVRVAGRPPERIAPVPDRAELVLGCTRLAFTRRA